MADHSHSHYDVHGVAEEYHRHYQMESTDEGLREDLARLEARVADLEEQLAEVRRGVQ